MRKNIIFFGELPPDVYNGISLSNEINISLLKEIFNVYVIAEPALFGCKPFSYMLRRLVFLISLPYQVWRKSKVRPVYSYSSLPTSMLGLLKIVVFLLFCKIFNRGILNVVHIHRGDFEKTYIQSKVMKLLYGVIFRFIDKTIVLSINQSAFICGNFKTDVFVVANTIEEHEVNLSASNKRNDKFIFIYLSNLIKEKGIFELVDAFESIKYMGGMELHFYGAFKNKMIEDSFRSYITTNDVYIHEPVYGNLKFDVLKEADVFVLPSFNEGQPLSIIESMSVGTPIICTNVGVVSDMFWSGYDLIVPPRDVNSLAEKMAYCYANKDSINYFNKLTSHYNCFFSKEAHASQLKAVFKSI